MVAAFLIRPGLVLAAVVSLACVQTSRADVTFDQLESGPLAGRAGWQDYDGGAALITVQKAEPPHAPGGTQVLATAVGNDFVSFIAPEPLGLGPSGRSSTVQADVCPGRTAILEISVGRDLEVKPEKGGGDGRRGPSFGFSAGNFILRSANPNKMVSAPAAATDDREDWYRMRMVIDFEANDGSGSASLQVRNITDDEPVYRTVIRDVDMLITRRMAAASRDPATWNAWLIRGNGAGGMADNLTTTPSPFE